MCTGVNDFFIEEDVMSNKSKVQNRRDIETRFKQVGDKPLSPKLSPINVRLTPDIDQLVRSLPNRSEWLRRVITEAAKKELTSEQEAS